MSLLLALGSTAVLSACVSMSGLGGESKYACAAPEGVTCQSVSGTYADATRNRSATLQRSALNPLANTDRRDGSGAGEPAADRVSDAWRTQARVLRLWTKAWEDADGDLWDQGYVYVQITNGAWRIDHIRQLIRDRYAPVRPPADAEAPDNESAALFPFGPSAQSGPAVLDAASPLPASIDAAVPAVPAVPPGSAASAEEPGRTDQAAPPVPRRTLTRPPLQLVPPLQSPAGRLIPRHQ